MYMYKSLADLNSIAEVVECQTNRFNYARPQEGRQVTTEWHARVCGVKLMLFAVTCTPTFQS